MIFLAFFVPRVGVEPTRPDNYRGLHHGCLRSTTLQIPTILTKNNFNYIFPSTFLAFLDIS